MSKHIHKLLALLLAVVLVVSLAACAKTPASSTNTDSKSPSGDKYYNETGFPICKEPITIEVTGVTGNTLDWNKTRTVKNIEKIMGIKMNCTTYADAEIFNTKYAVMLTSNKLPDLFLQLDMDKTEINKNGDDGYLLNMMDYIDLMPNFKKFMDEHPDFANYTKTSDGKIYSFNRCRDTWISRAMSWTFASNADLEKYSIDMSKVKTVDDFYQVLKKVKEADPNRVPFSLTFGGESGQRVDWMFKAAFGINTVNFVGGTGVDKDGKVFLYVITDNYREYLKYMNKLYTEKLMDNDAFTQTTDEFRSKIKNGTTMFWGDWSGLNGALGISDKDTALKYYALAGLTSDVNKTPTYLYYPEYTSNARVWVSKDTKYPEAICRLLDYPWSEEGWMFFDCGIEGEDFKYKKDSLGNDIVDSTLEGFWDSSKYKSSSEWKSQEVIIVNALQMQVTSFANKLIDKATDEELQKMMDDPEHDYTNSAALEIAIRRDTKEKAVSMPFLAYTGEEASKRASITTDMNNELKLAHAEFIRGDRDINSDADWDKYKKTIEGLGLADLLAIEQTAYERFIGSSK